MTAALVRGSRRAASWLGHPVHPMWTDLPIGFWTSSWVLDLLGDERDRRAARRLIALGVLSALPTMAFGVGDAVAFVRAPSRRRVAIVHGSANLGATLLYALSWRARARSHDADGVALAMAGAVVATLGAALGSHLALTDAGVAPAWPAYITRSAGVLARGRGLRSSDRSRARSPSTR